MFTTEGSRVEDAAGAGGSVLAGRYALRSELGRGRSAVVFLAEDLRLERPVAVKLLIPELRVPDGAAAHRLERERRLATSIVHPNVCAVSDAGQLADGSPFLVMELLSGETLARRLQRTGAIPLVDALQIAGQLLSALDAAHQLGIIHRDIKPENVFLVDLGLEGVLVKLLDFGASVIPGRVVRQFDARIDVFACGVLLFEMLTGRHPLAGVPPQHVGQAIALDSMPLLSSVAPTIPAGVARAVDTTLARDPDARHRDARAFHEALRAGFGTTDGVAAPAVASPLVEDWDLPTRQRPAQRPAPRA